MAGKHLYLHTWFASRTPAHKRPVSLTRASPKMPFATFQIWEVPEFSRTESNLWFPILLRLIESVFSGFGVHRPSMWKQFNAGVEGSTVPHKPHDSGHQNDNTNIRWVDTPPEQHATNTSTEVLGSDRT